jgi:glutamyl-tRNA reductase
MSAVVVAGGLGDMGRLITSALVETGKYEVYVISRRVCKSWKLTEHDWRCLKLASVTNLHV